MSLTSAAGAGARIAKHAKRVCGGLPHTRVTNSHSEIWRVAPMGNVEKWGAKLRLVGVGQNKAFWRLWEDMSYSKWIRATQ